MARPNYQNVSIAQLLEWSEANPHRTHSLEPIKIQPPATTTDAGTPLTKLGLPTYSAIPVSGILSVIAWIRDPMFSLANTTVRSTIVRDLATKLQIETDTLAGSSFARKRRRIFDAIGSALHGTPIEDNTWKDLICALAHLTEIQMIFVRDAKNLEETAEDKPEELLGASKGGIFFSSSPETWSNEKVTWIADWHGRWIAVPEDTETRSTTSRVLSFVQSIEDGGWIVDWPIVDATKEAIVEELRFSPTWQSTHSRLKKDVLASRLGRERVIRALTAL